MHEVAQRLAAKLVAYALISIVIGLFTGVLAGAAMMQVFNEYVFDFEPATYTINDNTIVSYSYYGSMTLMYTTVFSSVNTNMITMRVHTPNRAEMMIFEVQKKTYETQIALLVSVIVFIILSIPATVDTFITICKNNNEVCDDEDQEDVSTQ